MFFSKVYTLLKVSKKGFVFQVIPSLLKYRINTLIEPDYCHPFPSPHRFGRYTTCYSVPGGVLSERLRNGLSHSLSGSLYCWICRLLHRMFFRLLICCFHRPSDIVHEDQGAWSAFPSPWYDTPPSRSCCCRIIASVIGKSPYIHARRNTGCIILICGCGLCRCSRLGNAAYHFPLQALLQGKRQILRLPLQMNVRSISCSNCLKSVTNREKAPLYAHSVIQLVGRQWFSTMKCQLILLWSELQNTTLSRSTLDKWWSIN